MEPIILVAGSALGAFTALAMDKVSKGNAKPFMNDPSTHTIDLHRRVVTEAMNRVYNYEHQGRITGTEREKLIAKYRQEMNASDSKTNAITLHNLKELNTFKDSLVAVVDQRMAQINAKLDDITNKVANNAPVAHNKPTAHVERKEEKREAQKPVEPVETAESTESAESDASLDEIKKQIMQTLSRLEQAEVE